MTFEIECIIEAFAAECAQISLDVRVAFNVAAEEALQREHLAANPANEPVILCLHACKTQKLNNMLETG